ncbi:hypothetical protein [Thalassospira lucentensis]|uniref:hypothetical protein n=1 Tax=Thalassospira lucentensis TaxID=168935 RepID=UPI00142E1E3F|nr:hypothetical protein [Thalassospira lucentensis]NIZ01324.1 hypothetical protein [Thalassospira lucentensis]
MIATMENNIVILLCLIGFGLLAVGFSNRDENWGLCTMWVGALTMFGPVAWRLLTLFD